MNASAWKEDGKNYIHKGHSIFYRVFGSGDPLLLIHGFPTSSYDFNKIADGLAERFHVVAPDLIGYGYSDKPPEYEYSVMDHADLIEDLLKELRIESVRILAHDYGDTVAQELLARSADRRKNKQKGIQIESVCFMNGGLFPEAHKPAFIQTLLLSPLGKIVSQFITEGKFRTAFSEIFGPGTKPQDEELKEYWSLMQYNKGMRIYHKLINYINERKMHRARWVGAIMNARIPLRFINGPLDPISGIHMAQRYRELIPDADIVLLPNIGHYPQVESPKGVLDAFIEFVSKKKEED